MKNKLPVTASFILLTSYFSIGCAQIKGSFTVTGPSTFDNATYAVFSTTTSPTLYFTQDSYESNSLAPIDHLEVAVGSGNVSNGGNLTDQMGWTNIGLPTYYIATGLAMTPGNMYYASIRSVDKFGNKSSVSSSSGWHVETSSLNCPAGYVLVPEDPRLGVNQQFCVMSVEARAGANAFGCGTVANDCSSNHPYSTAVSPSVTTGLGVTPWVNISPQNATTACQNLGAGYDLITNAQWQAIARNAEANGANWRDGIPWGTTEINIGYSNNPYPIENALFSANTSTRSGVSYTPYPSANPATAWLDIVNTNNPWDGTQYDATGLSSHSSAAVWSQRRIHNVTNGQTGASAEIWDMGGDVYEYTKDYVGLLFTPSFSVASPQSGNCFNNWQCWVSYNSSSDSSEFSASNTTNREHFAPLNSLISMDKIGGRFFPDDPNHSYQAAATAMLRGGKWDGDTTQVDGGLFSTWQYDIYSSSTLYYQYGFRCIWQ